MVRRHGTPSWRKIVLRTAIEMHSTKCLTGSWVLRSFGSDYLPGLDTYPGVPFPALLTSDADSWLLIGQKQSNGDVEEITFSYRSNRTETRTFQLGKLNYERVAANHIILAIAANINSSFTECTIMRFGPTSGQRRYIYFLCYSLKCIS